MSTQATPAPSEFQVIISDLEGFASKEWQAALAEGRKIEQEIVPVLETGFATAAKDFGQLAVQTAFSLMTAEFAALTGQEKHGQTVTTLLQSAEAAGKTLALSDAQALATNAFVAVTGTAPAPAT
jgi:hypothetical protein